MSTIRDLIKRHSLVMYYALAFAISWNGGLLGGGGPRNILWLAPFFGHIAGIAFAQNRGEVPP